jgi:hypothetical protein
MKHVVALDKLATRQGKTRHGMGWIKSQFIGDRMSITKIDWNKRHIEMQESLRQAGEQMLQHFKQHDQKQKACDCVAPKSYYQVDWQEIKLQTIKQFSR